MNLHARLMGFLLICAVLIGLNVIATISGVYELRQGDDDNTATLTGKGNGAGICRLAAI